MVFRLSSWSGLFFNSVKNYSSSSLIKIKVHETTGITTLALQRPPVNSLNLELLREMLKTVQDLEKNRCRGLILTSVRTLINAGLDIREMYKPNVNRLKELWTTLQNLWINLYGSSYPTVAVINGHAPAGGCLLALSCEYRIMVKKFTIGYNETQLGAVAPSWFVASMRNAVGFRIAELALTTGKLFPTIDALKIGLIDEVAERKDDGIQKAELFLQQFANVPVFSRARTKKLLRGADIQDLVNNREQDLNNLVALITSSKLQEAIELYLEFSEKNN